MKMISVTYYFNHWLYFLPVFFFCTTMANSQNFNSDVEAIIKTNDEKNDILDITGVAKNITGENQSLRYELSVITSSTGSNNSSKNAQSGYFTLEPYETKDLSRTSVSVSPTNRTIILLLIYNADDELIGTARKVYNDEEDKETKEQASYTKPYEGIELTGMVTEKTKTKPGRDFYNLFYQKYRLSDSPGNKIIEIEEVIGFGRSTRIMVKIDDKVIFQFWARPKLDYLEQMVDYSLRRVNQYFLQQKQNEQYITQY